MTAEIDAYQAFLNAKAAMAAAGGFDCEPDEVNPLLKPHQRDIVCWAVRGGRRAIFAAFGLGKTLMQLEILRLVLKKSGGGNGLIVLPLGVRQEFKADAQKLGLDLGILHSDSLAVTGTNGIYLTNYETVRDGKLDPRGFQAVSLDEAAVLRGFGGTKTFRQFMKLYEGTSHYRFVATATPSPNEYIELLAYAAFLDVMDVGQAKTRFFKRDSTKADVLTLHPHKSREFWLWVASWAMFVQKPSDLCRCLCHAESSYSASGSDGSSSRTGYQAHSGTGLGSVDVTAGTPSSPDPATSSKASSLAAGASGPSMEEREREPTVSGEASSTGALGQDTKTGQTMEEGASPSAIAGDGSPTSSPTWDNPQSEPLSNASTTTGTTTPATAAGLADSTKPETVESDERRRAPAGRGWCDTCRCDEGYDLPPLQVCWHELPAQASTVTAERDGQGRLLHDTSLGVTAAAREKRAGIGARVERVMEIARQRGDDQLVVWCDLNAEQRALEDAFQSRGVTVSSLYGSTSVDDREAQLTQWKSYETEVFLSKPMMYGAGVNLQQSHTMIFAGIGFKFAEVFQAVHRIHRFLQQHPCTVHFIYTEAEREVRRVLERKWAQHDELVAMMGQIIRDFGLSHAAMAHALGRTVGVKRQWIEGENYRLVNNDAVEESRLVETESVGLIVTSIPFATQYEYTPSYNDFGHTDSNEHFWQQMDFLTPELYRVLQPGRVAVIHVKDRIVPGGLTGLGFQTASPFHAEAIAHYREHGFAYLGMKTVVTDVVRENNQTYRLGWTEQCKDGSRMGCGMPEYLLLFRKPPTDSSNGYADLPVVKDKKTYTLARWQLDAHAFSRSSGNRLLSPEDLEGIPHSAIYKLFKRYSLTEPYDMEQHVRLAQSLGRRLPVTFMLLPPHSWHPDVWTDVARMRTLNTLASAKGREMHLCPLQFDIVDRLIAQYSMPGETVFDPFSGMGTVAYCAVKAGRRGLGIELSPLYHAEAARYMQAAEENAGVPTLFDLLDASEDITVKEAV